MNAVFLDFDGVIADSIDECYLVAKQAYFGFAKLPTDEGNLRGLFVKYRGNVRPVYQYMLLLRAFEVNEFQDDSESILASFLTLENNVSEKEKERFETLFFRARELGQVDKTAWLKLNPLTGFGKGLIGRNLDDVYIVTTKDKKSVNLILQEHNIRLSDVFDKQAYREFGDKGKIIKHVMDQNSKYVTGIFVDDAVGHLDAVNDPRITCYFADWGYGENSCYPVFNGIIEDRHI